MDQDFQKYYDLLLPKVKKNVEIITPETLGQSFLLRIDKKPASFFIPFISRRSYDDEDNTTPRIPTSDNIIGCILGQAAVPYDFYTEKNHGFYISMINFDYALKISTKLVKDADIVNEHWLVTYNKETLKYPAKQIGKLFVTKVEDTRSPGRKSLFKSTVTFLIQIDESIKIRYTENKVISKGYYECILDNTHLERMDIKSISEVQYMKEKELSATMLSLEQQEPLFNRW